MTGFYKARLRATRLVHLATVVDVDVDAEEGQKVKDREKCLIAVKARMAGLQAEVEVMPTPLRRRHRQRQGSTTISPPLKNADLRLHRVEPPEVAEALEVVSTVLQAMGDRRANRLTGVPMDTRHRLLRRLRL